ncbi:MAG: bifunctional 5,10-methylenetetrahydrofolate dehydrogenase/5,10-methenyltetrahydrofolate cyclohydrolase [Candidatus Lokiarchaeota archaeon]|nr:bifunctional 5,10-methylenetetrahydrofolate dehydrogenase/5,10-methenyltetrahydrofolate cyclohydrolase [Candidatus Lokiarchaeota archaeon]
MGLILDGKKTSEKIKLELQEKIIQSVKLHDRHPGLSTILVGEDAASKMYVDMKIKACDQVGITSKSVHLPENCSFSQLVAAIDEINYMDDIDGILLQLPLPPHLRNRTDEIVQKISPEKDVDGLSPYTIGLTTMGDETYTAATPKGMIRLLEEYDIKIEGKEVVIVNRSIIIGKPLVMMFLKRNGTVTVCHTRTKDLDFHMRRADILVTGVGRVNFVTKDRIKEGVVYIDAGINRDEKGKLCGDADFEGIKDKCTAITPVPGGVGPMTIAMLLENTYLSFLKRIRAEKKA